MALLLLQLLQLVQLLLKLVNLLGLFLQLLLQVADDEDMIWSLQEMIWILLLLRHGASYILLRFNGATQWSRDFNDLQSGEVNTTPRYQSDLSQNGRPYQELDFADHDDTFSRAMS